MNNGKRTNTKGNGGGRRRTHVPKNQIPCKYEMRGGCNNTNCQYMHNNHHIVPYMGRQMVPAGNQMVPSGGHMEQAGFEIVNAFKSVFTEVVAPLKADIASAKQDARDASVKADEAFSVALEAKTTADGAIDSFKEEMAKERKAREAERKDEMKLMLQMMHQQFKITPLSDTSDDVKREGDS